MADLSEYVPPTLTNIFPPVLSRMLYKSKMNNFNIGFSVYASLERSI